MREVSRRVTRTTIAVAIVLVATTAFLAVTLFTQNQTLGDNAVVTRDIVNANARTVGQVQRELLRLTAEISSGQSDPEVLELHRSFVAQRIDESTLDNQLQTLGSQELLDRTRRLDQQWHSVVQPLVEAIIADPTGAADTEREAAVAGLQALEREYNDISTDAEQNRKDQATSANEATVRSLNASRLVLAAIFVLLLAFMAFFVVALIAFRRTARSQMETARRLGEVNAEMLKLSYVASATDNMVIITDAMGFTEWVNDAFTRVTGYTFEDVRGLRPGWVLQGPGTDRSVVDELRHHLERGEGHVCELLNYRKTGEEYWVEVEVQPVRGEDGTLTHFIAVESDITQRRQAEEQLVQAKEAAESLATEKANFLASMSHEIRTPLNSVIGLTGLLLDTDLTDDQREFAETARNSGSMLLSIVNNILNFSALEAGNIDSDPVHFVLGDLLDRSVGLLARQARLKGLDVSVSVDPDLPTVVVGDETRLQQVLVNLVANAVKFTEAGGISVTASRDADAATTDDEGVPVVIRVADTGIGIPDDRLHRLFKPFSQVDASTTRRYGGTGLGLAISHHIVTLLGGEIDVTSAPGHGTTFEIRLRLNAGDASALRPADTSAAPVGAGHLRILVAEDDKVNQLVLERMLERLGYRATMVNDGLAAIEALGKSRYDVILMDVQMPRLDGVGATQRIRAQLPHSEQPVIVAVTASALEGDREKLIAAGMDMYLSKPIQLQALETTLASAAKRSHVPLDGSVRGSVAEPVDFDAFRQAIGSDDDELLYGLVATFVESAYELLDGMLRALAENDAFGMQVLAHQMKDRAASACATSVAQVAADLQTAAQPGSMHDASPFIARLGGELERVRTWHRAATHTGHATV